MNSSKVILLSSVFLITLPFRSIEASPEIQSKESSNLKENALYRESLALVEARDFKSAIKSITSYLKENDSSPEGYFLRGKSYHELGILDKASADYKKAIELDPPSSHKAHNNNGLIYGEIKSFELAIESFTKAIKVNPRSKEAYNNRGVAKAASGDTNGAVKDFSKSINMDNTYLEPLLNRSFVYEMKGQLDKACSDWKAAGKMGSKNARIWHKYQCRS